MRVLLAPAELCYSSLSLSFQSSQPRCSLVTNDRMAKQCHYALTAIKRNHNWRSNWLWVYRLSNYKHRLNGTVRLRPDKVRCPFPTSSQTTRPSIFTGHRRSWRRLFHMKIPRSWYSWYYLCGSIKFVHTLQQYRMETHRTAERDTEAHILYICIDRYLHIDRDRERGMRGDMPYIIGCKRNTW